MSRLSRLAAPAVLLALCVGFYWRLALTDQYVWFDHPDMCYIEIPRVQFQANEIHRGQFPLWDHRIWAGQPLIGQTQPGPLYPFNLLFAALPLTAGYIRLIHLNWYFVFIHFQAALFCYWLARDLERSRFASLIAASVFSFGGFVGSVAWLDVLNGAVWTPLVVLFLLRSLRGRSPVASAALGGFWLGIAWLCGHHEIPMLVSYLAAFIWLFHVFRTGRPDWRILRLAGVFFALVFLTSAVQTFPTFEFGRLSQRWVGLDHAFTWSETIPYLAHTTYSMPVRGLLGLALFGMNHADSSLFIGVLGLGLAVLGVIGSWTRSAVRCLAVAGLLAILYSMGAFTPIHGVFYSLAPMLDKARVTVRAIHLVHFSIAVLAAFGVDVLLERLHGHWIRRAAWTWAAFGCIIVAAAVVSTLLGRPEQDGGTLMSGYVALAAAAMIFAYQREVLTRRWLLAGVLTLVVVELGAVQNYPNRHDKNRNRFVEAMQSNRDVAEYLRQQPGPVRAAVNDQDVPSNFGDWHGVDMLQGYVAGAPVNLLLHPLHTRETRNLFAVNYWVSREPERAEQQLVYTGQSGVKVFKNPHAMPRAWTSHEAVRVNNNAELQAIISQPDFDPRRRVGFVAADPPALESCPGESKVEIKRHHSNRITMRAEMACRGMVVIADSYYPGWRASVDGKSTPILETWGAMRGLVVDKGVHIVEMRFHPMSVYLGGVLTLFGGLLAGVAWKKR